MVGQVGGVIINAINTQAGRPLIVFIAYLDGGYISQLRV